MVIDQQIDVSIFLNYKKRTHSISWWYNIILDIRQTGLVLTSILCLEFGFFRRIIAACIRLLSTVPDIIRIDPEFSQSSVLIAETLI